MAFQYCGFADEAGRPLDVQLATLREVGWKGIEPRMVGEKHVCDLNGSEWDDFRSRIERAGIAIPSVGGQIANWARPIDGDFQKDIDELRRVAPRMKQTGTRIIRIMSYPNAKEPWPVAKWRDETIRRLRELARMAEDYDVILGHENCSGYGGAGPAAYLEIATAVNSPALKFIFDTGNSTLHDNDAAATWAYYQAVRDQIVHVHIKAYRPGPDGKMKTCFADEDPMQARIVADLKRRDYRGWVSIEPHLAAIIHEGTRADDTDAPRRTWVEYARRLERLVARA